MLPKVASHDLHTGLLFLNFIFLSPSSCDSCCTVTRVPLWFVPKPEVKIKLSKSSEFDSPAQLWAEKLLCQAWLAIKHLWPRAKKYHPLKVNWEVLSLLSTNCSAALPPQGHFTSRLSSPRGEVSSPCAGTEPWEGENHPFLPKRSTTALYYQQPRDYRGLWWIANPAEQMTD